MCTRQYDPSGPGYAVVCDFEPDVLTLCSLDCSCPGCKAIRQRTNDYERCPMCDSLLVDEDNPALLKVGEHN